MELQSIRRTWQLRGLTVVGFSLPRDSRRSLSASKLGGLTKTYLVILSKKELFWIFRTPWMSISMTATDPS